MISRRHSLLGLAATALAPLPGRAAERSVRMVAAQYPPYTGATLPGGGIASQITREALRQAGWEMTLAFRPWARAMLELQRGEHDGIIGIWKTTEREAWLAYPPSLGLGNQIGFVARADRRVNVADLTSLRNLTIGVVNGYANPDRFERAQLQTETAVDDMANLRKLLAGRIDLALIEKGLAAYLIDTQFHDVPSRLVWLEPALVDWPLYSAFAKQGEGDRFAGGFGRAMAQLQSTGRLAAMLQQGSRWLHPPGA